MSNLVSSFEKKTIIGFEESNKKIIEIDINKVKQDVGQVRSFFDEEKLDELADSIKQHGILNPIHVHHVDDSYIIITGERRYRACQKIGMNTIPSIVHHDISEKDIKALQLIENLQREDLSAIETAKGFKSLKETGLKQRQIARSLGVSESTVTKYLAVIDPKKIPIDWLEQIEENHGNASLNRDLSLNT